MKKGAYVKKSTYQKQVAKNTNLLADINLLVNERWKLMPEQILCKIRWREYFAKEKLIISLLRDYARRNSITKFK